uniref:Terminase, small subunit n=1 Tax=Siphoviridae sp. ctiJm4 TaxID=2827916 RepID=A0A8S5T197_9CAUD|nr:MAG TPA: Putative terminase, small subunit [Siphoviridae sp. ctiJm4]
MGNWKSDYIAVRFSPDEIPAMKKQYAKLLARWQRDSDKAFTDPQMDIIFKFDVSAKLYAKNNWIFDEEVISFVEHYLNDGLIDVLPSKEKIAQMLLDVAHNTHNAREKILALKEYSEIMGFSNSSEPTESAVQNVILLTDNGSELTWEEKMRQQQHNLKEQAESLLAENE